jgi:hypothetical protein
MPRVAGGVSRKRGGIRRQCRLVRDRVNFLGLMRVTMAARRSLGEGSALFCKQNGP